VKYSCRGQSGAGRSGKLARVNQARKLAGERIEVLAMRLHRLRFTIGRLMTVVAVSALVLTPFAWTSPGSPLPLLLGVLTVGLMLLIVSSPFLLDWLGRDQGLGPRSGLASKTTKYAVRYTRLTLSPTRRGPTRNG